MADRTRIVGSPALQMGWLVIMNGPRAGRDFRLGRVTNIGRDPMHNDIILEDETVSAAHVRIKLERRRYVLYDLASSNGTTVNGQRVQRHSLADEHEIVLGDARLRFKESRS